jgi:hypothetical protein
VHLALGAGGHIEDACISGDLIAGDGHDPGTRGRPCAAVQRIARRSAGLSSGVLTEARAASCSASAPSDTLVDTVMKAARMTLAGPPSLVRAEERRAAIAEIADRDRGRARRARCARRLPRGRAAKPSQRPAADACRALGRARRRRGAAPRDGARIHGPSASRFGRRLRARPLGHARAAAALSALLEALALATATIRWAAAELICRTEPRAARVAGLLPLCPRRQPTAAEDGPLLSPRLAAAGDESSVRR